MTAATLGVIGPTEWVLIVIGAILIIGVPTVAAVVVWKLLKREQARRRGVT